MTVLCLPPKYRKMVKEWLTQKRQDFEEKQDITKYDTLPVTYQWIESRVKFIDELLSELDSNAAGELE